MSHDRYQVYLNLLISSNPVVRFLFRLHVPNFGVINYLANFIIYLAFEFFVFTC